MVDIKGNLIYTDFKEKDYATNLKDGVYSNTGIARAYKKALSIGDGELAFDDFKPYEPSYTVKTHDEIGTISNNLNKYLESIEQNIKNDANFITDLQSVINRLSKGWFSQHVQANTNNPILMEVKRSFNQGLDNLRAHFVQMDEVLTKYSNYNYTQKLEVHGIEKNGVFESLINNINTLRDSINSMLVENKQNGLTLDQSARTLLTNVNTMNSNLNESAASLEETVAAVEEITGNIRNNTENVVRMSDFTNQLTNSARDGSQLAQKTTDSMEKLNNEVNAINDSITVIDQIAFQTNILSLNTAVEAATAGEAGKGFAVVAGEVRNLASRSAEAAKDIKHLVENANTKSFEGKEITQSMISGYSKLTANVEKTLELIKDIENASKEQLVGMEQINDSMTVLDTQIQSIASISDNARNISEHTDEIAKLVVANADAKEFVGKDSVKPKEMNINISNEPLPTKTKKEIKKAKTIKQNNNQDKNWESF
jgi:methyl-accepting chemotaxis protein